jgi:cell division protein FtsL
VKGLRSHKNFVDRRLPGTWNRAIIPLKAPYPIPADCGETRGNEYRDRSKNYARWRMSSILTMMLVVWAVLTALLIILLIYRSTLSLHEEDQLFLDEAQQQMEQEQAEIQSRMNKTQWPMRVLSAASGMLILLIAGMWVWEGLSRVQ